MVWEGSLLSTPSTAFILCGFVDDGHFDWPYQRLDSCPLLLLSEDRALHKGGELVDKFVCMSGTSGGSAVLGLPWPAGPFYFLALTSLRSPDREGEDHGVGEGLSFTREQSHGEGEGLCLLHGRRLTPAPGSSSCPRELHPAGLSLPGSHYIPKRN